MADEKTEDESKPCRSAEAICSFDAAKPEENFTKTALRSGVSNAFGVQIAAPLGATNTDPFGQGKEQKHFRLYNNALMFRMKVLGQTVQRLE